MENQADKERHGSAAATAGERNVKAKLTWKKVEEIRTLYRQGGWRYIDLADRYGVSFVLIGKIVRNLVWKPQHRPAGIARHG